MEFQTRDALRHLMNDISLFQAHVCNAANPNPSAHKSEYQFVLVVGKSDPDFEVRASGLPILKEELLLT